MTVYGYLSTQVCLEGAIDAFQLGRAWPPFNEGTVRPSCLSDVKRMEAVVRDKGAHIKKLCFRLSPHSIISLHDKSLSDLFKIG